MKFVKVMFSQVSVYRGMLGRGNVLWGACKAGGMHGRGAYVVKESHFPRRKSNE